jgi:N-ethylmaleimide reductase
VIVALCDYPLVSAPTVAALIAQHGSTPDSILLPSHQGLRGHPLLFPRTILDELDADLTLRDLVRRDPQRVLCCNVDDPGVLIDMDTPEDYHRIVELIETDETLERMESPMKLFTNCRLGGLELNNRIVMAPMTRSRATGNLPNGLMAEYYSQRAAAGLIITEGTSPSPNGLGYARIPGIYSAEQTAAWKQVTDAVHARGGKIFIQLMHAGRVGSVLNLPSGAELVAPSVVALSGNMWTDSQGEQPHDLPREMSADDIRTAIGEYVQASRNAIDAGFDGVEIHGANGYLITQFLDPGSNLRSDAYGVDAAGRNRFALEVAEEVITAIGAERVGIRLSPYGVFNDMSGSYDGIAAQYTELAAALGGLGLLYLHLVDHSAMGAPKPDPATVTDMSREFRAAGGRAVILSGGYDRERAELDLQSGAADLIAYGRPFISNPDLVERMKAGIATAEPDQATFYTPGPLGYTDYPAVTG